MANFSCTPATVPGIADAFQFRESLAGIRRTARLPNIYRSSWAVTYDVIRDCGCQALAKIKTDRCGLVLQSSSSRVKSLSAISLPPKSNDKDFHMLLSNLSRLHDLVKVHTLNLAFTEITDRSIDAITQLKGLKKLNLWATKVRCDPSAHLSVIHYRRQFGRSLDDCSQIIPSGFQISDIGLEAICYSLKDLEDINLCETPIGERGVEALTSLNKLRVVNLNSTKVTMDAYCKLKVCVESECPRRERDLFEIEIIT